MNHFNSVSVHPEIQDGAPVLAEPVSGLKPFDYMRIGVSLNEFLDEFPSITRDQAVEVMEMVQQQRFSLDQFQQGAAA